MLGEAQKHGRSTTGVSVAFGKGDDVCAGDLTKRNQNSEKKKAVNPQSFRAKRHVHEPRDMSTIYASWPDVQKLSPAFTL